MTKFSTLRVTNAQDHEVSLVVEPWGEIYPMASGATFEVRFEVAGEQAKELPEIVWEKDQILIYAGVNGDIALFRNGINLREPSFNGTHQPAIKELSSVA